MRAFATCMRIVCLGLCIASLGCSNPRDTPLPTDLAKMEALKPTIEKLQPEERELLAGYIVRHTIGAAFGTAFGVKSDPIPEGMTIGKAIEAQRQFVARQKADEADRKAARAKSEAQRKLLADQMAQILTIRLTSLNLHKATFRDMDVESYVRFGIEVENKGAKPIAGLKGTAMFKDKFGDTVSELPMKFEHDVAPGQTARFNLQKRFSQLNDEDRRLANLDPASVTFIVTPEVIIFGDGSKFEAPKQKD